MTPRNLRLNLAILTAAALVGAAAAAPAQTSTGRYAPERRSEPGRLSVSAGSGALTSGDVFVVRVPGDVVQRWLAPSGTEFAAREFRVTLDEDVLAAVGLAYEATDVWSLRLDLSYSEVDMTALARTSQTVELIPYDRLTFVMAGLEVERALVRAPTHPYLLAGGAVAGISAARAEALDQTRFGLRLGAGLHWPLDPRWAVRLEIRDTIVQIEAADHEPVLVAGDRAPALEELGPQSLFEIGASIRARF